MSLVEEVTRRVARYADRREDWTVFGFETALDARYARSQRRYIGASGSVDHADPHTLEPVAFTMSIQTIPPGNRIPAHCHETEETFFILDGRCRIQAFRGSETASIELNRWDLISIAPHIYHDIHNVGDIDCAIQTLLSKARPERPNYQDPRLLDLQARTKTC